MQIYCNNNGVIPNEAESGFSWNRFKEEAFISVNDLVQETTNFHLTVTCKDTTATPKPTK